MRESCAASSPARVTTPLPMWRHQHIHLARCHRRSVGHSLVVRRRSLLRMISRKPLRFCIRAWGLRIRDGQRHCLIECGAWLRVHGRCDGCLLDMGGVLVVSGSLPIANSYSETSCERHDIAQTRAASHTVIPVATSVLPAPQVLQQCPAAAKVVVWAALIKRTRRLNFRTSSADAVQHHGVGCARLAVPPASPRARLEGLAASGPFVLPRALHERFNKILQVHACMYFPPSSVLLATFAWPSCARGLVVSLGALFWIWEEGKRWGNQFLMRLFHPCSFRAFAS